MLVYLALTLLAVTFARSSPLHERALLSPPTVEIKNGTVIGSSLGGIDSFQGIPFAQPPVGQLRLKPPLPIRKSFGTLHATSVPSACPQLGSYVNTTSLGKSAKEYLDLLGLGQNITNVSEDCLTLTVQRPANLTSDSKLPVLFWIFGGGFETGSTSQFDGSGLVQRSISMEQPMIYVAVNYRLNAFGFLAGKELAAERATNLGLRDQRLGMAWVQENIAAFGGDPDKVTIWGESAGSISVFDHLIINGGDNTYNGRPLFRGAIMDSGSSFGADPVTAPQAQKIYDTVADAAGCTDASDSLACLRSVDFATFFNAANSVPSFESYRALDVSFLPRPDPSDNFFSRSPEVPFKNQQYAKVPIIIGDQEDEGTVDGILTPNISTNAEVIGYFTSYFPGAQDPKTLVTGLVKLYPDEPHKGQPQGSPFNTGGLNNIYPQFKRMAAIFGDWLFILTRRNYLNSVSSTVPAWSYLASYLHGTPVLGTFHSSDLLFIYDILTSLPEPTRTTQEYYINFVNHLNPNGPTGRVSNSSLIHWPRYSKSSPQLLHLLGTENKLIPDTFRQPAARYLAAHASEFRI